MRTFWSLRLIHLSAISALRKPVKGLTSTSTIRDTCGLGTARPVRQSVKKLRRRSLAVAPVHAGSDRTAQAARYPPSGCDTTSWSDPPRRYRAGSGCPTALR